MKSPFEDLSHRLVERVRRWYVFTTSTGRIAPIAQQAQLRPPSPRRSDQAWPVGCRDEIAHADLSYKWMF